MKNNYGKMFLTVVLLSLVIVTALALGRLDEAGQKNKKTLWDSASSGQKVTVKGTLRLVGSEPLTELVITDSDQKDWYIEETEVAILRKYDQMSLTVLGTVKLKKMILANGKSLGDRRILTKISIGQ